MYKGINKILEYNLPANNYIKLAGELAELQEVIIKYYDKSDSHKPPMSRIIEEMGDVLVRMKLIAYMENIESDVNNRVHSKIKQLLGYIEEGKYKGGV